MPQDSSTKPREVYVESRPAAPQDAEAAADALEEHESRTAIETLRRSQRDTVAEFLGERFWLADKTWPCLWWQKAGIQLSVSMYFPRLNLAVDKFPRPTDMQRLEAEFKASRLGVQGVKYKALFPESRLADLAKAR